MPTRIHGNQTAKVSIAVILTIASVIMIFGVWTIFRPSPDWNEDEGFRYNTWFATNAMLEPSGTLGYSFDATKGQMMMVSISGVYTPADGRDTMVNVPPSISVTLTDSAGNKLIDVARVQAYDTFEPILIESTGEQHIEVVNNQDRLFSVGLRVTSVEKSEAVEALGLMLTFMSLPIFMLGIWLFAVRK